MMEIGDREYVITIVDPSPLDDIILLWELIEIFLLLCAAPDSQLTSAELSQSKRRPMSDDVKTE
jgi:hypothetical protein